MRVFINESGRIYRAEEPKSIADAESNFPTADMLAVLDENPVTREEMIKKIIDLGNKRATAVLASEVNPHEGETTSA